MNTLLRTGAQLFGGRKRRFFRKIDGIVFGAVALIAAMGCAKKDAGQQACASTTKAVQGEPIEVLMSVDPLLVQISEGSTAYMHYFPAAGGTGDIVRANPSALSAVYARAVEFKIAQSGINGTPAVVISTDDLARCDALVGAINDVRRAGIETVIFDTVRQKSGESREFAAGCVMMQVLPRIPGKLIKDPRKRAGVFSFSILKNKTLVWKDRPATFEELAFEMRAHVLRVGPENTIVAIDVDGEASGSVLRHMIDQAQQCTIWRVVISLRKST